VSAPDRRLTLGTMRLLAGALLVAMSGLYLLAVLHHAVGPWGYLRAFAEAAMVGGLADWFAVTAIFRRPLGLPIPHTAVIPRSKGRIADALGEFVAVNFLAPDIVRNRLETQNLAAALATQIADPVAARRIADGIVAALPGVVDLLDDETVGAFIRRQIGEMSREDVFASAIGRGLKVLTDHGRHQPVLDAALDEGWRALEDNEETIRALVRTKTSWMWRVISLDARASDALIGAIEETLRAMAADDNHPARQRITELLQRFAEDVQHSPALREQIQRVVADLLAHPSVDTYFRDVWSSVKNAVAKSAAAEQSEARTTLADAITHFGAALKADAEVQDAINRRLRALLVEIADRHGRDIAALISDTIKGWDAKTVVEKLEQNVGPDLQYIRINGTLIGGLIGLAIHQITLTIAAHT